MNRRSFLLALLAAPAAATGLTQRPARAALPLPLEFHPDAFSLVMAPLALEQSVERYVVPAMQQWFDRAEAQYAAEIRAVAGVVDLP